MELSVFGECFKMCETVEKGSGDFIKLLESDTWDYLSFEEAVDAMVSLGKNMDKYITRNAEIGSSFLENISALKTVSIPGRRKRVL